MKNNLRVGRITSSEIYLLLSSRKGVAQNYIDECNMELRLGRALNSEASARPLTWGKICEIRLCNLLGLDYKPMMDEVLIHAEIPFWAGSPDARKFDEGGTVVEVKSPYTLKSFCTLVDAMGKGETPIESMKLIRENHKDGEKFYWQCISNAILTGSRFAELHIYLPYESELDAIRNLTEDMDDPNEYAWIHFGSNKTLPCLADNGYYKNHNVIRFEIPQDDKDLLTATVQAAGLRLETVEQVSA